MIQESIQKIHVQSGSRSYWIDFIFLLLVTSYVLLGTPLVPFHGDESAFLILSGDYNSIVKKHDFEKVLFKVDGGIKQNLRLTTGAILPFSIGFVRDITNNDDPIGKWLWGASWEENVAIGNLPTPRLLNLARACSVILGAAGIVILFLLAWKLFETRLIAWLAVLVLATQGSVLVNIRRAMQEGPKFFLLILTAYIASNILKDLLRGTVNWQQYAFLGAASGLSLAAKQDTALMLVIIYLVLGIVTIWQRFSLAKNLVILLYLCAATILAYAFFLAFMPVFWSWWESVIALTGLALILFQLPIIQSRWTAKFITIAGCGLLIISTLFSPNLWTRLHVPVSIMMETRENLIKLQMASLAGQNLLGDETFGNRLSFLVESTISSKVMYMETNSFDIPLYHTMISSYENSLFSGRTGSLFMDGLILILVLIGVRTLLINFTAQGLFSNFLFFGMGILLFIMIPLSWQRYFLIMQIPYSLLAGVGGQQVWLWWKQYSAGYFSLAK